MVCAATAQIDSLFRRIDTLECNLERRLAAIQDLVGDQDGAIRADAYYTVQEAADLLQFVDGPTVRRWCADGQIAGAVKRRSPRGGKPEWRIPGRSLKQVRDERGVPARKGKVRS